MAIFLAAGAAAMRVAKKAAANVHSEDIHEADLFPGALIAPQSAQMPQITNVHPPNMHTALQQARVGPGPVMSMQDPGYYPPWSNVSVLGVINDWENFAHAQAERSYQSNDDETARSMRSTQTRLAQIRKDIYYRIPDRVFAFTTWDNNIGGEVVQAVATVTFPLKKDILGSLRKLARARGYYSRRYDEELIEVVEINDIVATPKVRQNDWDSELIHSITNWAARNGLLVTVKPYADRGRRGYYERLGFDTDRTWRGYYKRLGFEDLKPCRLMVYSGYGAKASPGRQGGLLVELV